MIDPADTADLQLEDVEDYNADYPPIGFPQGDENIHTSGGGLNKPRYRRGALRNLLTRNKWATGFAAILVLICIVTISVVAGGGKSSNKSGSPFGSSAKNQAPIVIDPDSLDPAYTGPLLIELKDAYGRHGLDPSVLDKEAGTTPQRHAFYWMATDEELKNFDHTETIQRYAMAVLYYATNSVPNDEVEETIPWIDGTGWLSDAHVCEGWRGIECNGQMHVKAITLKENRLTGSLPQELALLSQNLESIDLSTNMILMEGDMYDVFKTLDQLETLILDDNYMKSSNGLPYQFKHLKKLEKLRMSYNLLGGELETEDRKVLKHLGALTHLELESNFLTGNMPPDISGLTDLVYLYMRRNEMEFNLDFLKGGTLVELFAVWLDDNDVYGSIPTEIALLTDLASISITNSSLTGKIPTEMGNLYGLRRLWLYGNDLTGGIPSQLSNLEQLEVLELHDNDISGAVPQGICASIQKSEYELKALTADCNPGADISCPEDCCTKCHD